MASETTSLYTLPQRWMSYETTAILDQLIEARSAAGVLNRLPYLQQWIEQVHEEQLRLEAAGTSRIEGAEFTDEEQEIALASQVPPDVDLTRSQRQLRAADATYRWLRSQPTDQPITTELVLDIHRRMVTGCDDDRCEPGALRPADWNVTFGTPRCRGAEGGTSAKLPSVAFVPRLPVNSGNMTVSFKPSPLTIILAQCTLLGMATGVRVALWRRSC